MRIDMPEMTLDDSQAIVSRHKAIFESHPTGAPADKAVDAPLLGNGDMGVVLAGDVEKPSFILCKNDLWRLEHKYGRSSPVPLGSLNFHFRGFSNPSYRAEQDLFTATTKVYYEKGESTLIMNCYVAAEKNVLVVELKSVGVRINARASLNISGGRGSETSSGNDGPVFWGKRNFISNVDIPSGAAAAWTLKDSEALGPDGSFVVTPKNPVILTLGMESLFAHEDYLSAAKKSLQQLTGLRACHKTWWRNYWERSYVKIDDPVIEKQYYQSLYGMGSCSRDISFPPNIFGWVTTDSPLWNGDYHLNYNHQAPFYGLSRANRLEQADPHDSPFLDFMERAEWHCQEIFGHDGGIYPVGIGPKGIETTYEAEKYYGNVQDCVENRGLFYHQRSNGAYGIVNMAPRWYTTLDMEYGKRIYPFVKQIAVFWQNYLTWEEEGQRFIIENDSCHEGSPDTEMNSCVSLSLCRLAITLAIDLSAALEQDTDTREPWQNILKHLSPISTQEREGKEVFRYTEKHGRDWWKNNTIGIQPIYPAGQVGLDSDEHLLQVARNTVEDMKRWHDNNGSNSFFPAAVRVGHSPQEILEELNTYSQHAYPNGFQEGNPHGIENMSTVPNTINEMLCMDHGGTIRAFPVWPKERDATFVNIRCHGAFLVSSELKEGKVSFLRILSEKGSTLQIFNPWGSSEIRVTRNKSSAEAIKGERLLFETEEDEEIWLEPT